MSRSGYNDDCEPWDLIRWRGAVNSAIKGARGQAFLKEMLAAFDAMPEKKLIAEELALPDGAVCAMGAVGKARGTDMTKIPPDCRDSIAHAFGIAPALAAEIAFENDQDFRWKNDETPEARFMRMRQWIISLIKPEPGELK